MKTTLSPYLMFNGNCREAMTFYQAILGGELTVQTYGEGGFADDPIQKDRVMHSAIKNDALSFMASDEMPGSPTTYGDNIRMAIVGSDEKKLTEFFNKLSEGGKIGAPLEKAPWGDLYGMFIDKFGIHWMIDIGPETEMQK